MALTDSLKALFIDTSKALKGSSRRLFMAARSRNSGQAVNAGPNANWAGTV